MHIYIHKVYLTQPIRSYIKPDPLRNNTLQHHQHTLHTTSMSYANAPSLITQTGSINHLKRIQRLSNIDPLMAQQ
jgi:hypothetical protein